MTKEVHDMKDQKTKERFIELRAEGLSYQKIAQQLKVSKQTLIAWSKELNHDIANLKAIRIEAILEEYCVFREKRIELLGNKLKGLITELDKRDLIQIPTEKLFELVLKYGKALKEEEKPTCFAEEIDDISQSFRDFTHTETWVA